jgi:hypothetical protein
LKFEIISTALIYDFGHHKKIYDYHKQNSIMADIPDHPSVPQEGLFQTEIPPEAKHLTAHYTG